MRRISAAVAATLGLLVSAGTATASGPADSALALAAQAAANAQGAGAQSGASQSSPANQNISVRVQSPGSGGDVTQSNTAASGATATNANVTGQSAGQTQTGSCNCGGGTQATGQDASSSQSAAALSHASQSGASNENISVRVQSPGDDGNVTQSNTAVSGAAATNANATGQSAGQSSAGGSGTQAVGQDAQSDQTAAAASSAEQTGATNSNISVRVQSAGDDGDVEQSNTVASAATAGNLNLTEQEAGQAGGSGTQAIGQDAKSEQTAAALSSAEQTGARNEHIGVRVQSPGDGGSVTQSNTAVSAAAAGNLNGTSQGATQAQSGSDCRCGSGGTQAIGQDAGSHQGALAVSRADQAGAWNAITPVRVDSRGDDGDVEQSNTVVSAATAANANGLEQEAAQTQGGSSCCGSGVQAIGQESDNHQAALAASVAAQHGADRCGCGSSGNSYEPVRVDSPGDGGSIEQSNTVVSAAAAGNLNLTGQGASQAQSGGGVQAIGQEAKSEQAAIGLSAALQQGASNSATPVRVDSPGEDGDVSQSNTVASAAQAGNGNLTVQEAGQSQAAACGCGAAVQAIGQEASNGQLALAGSLAAQLGARNESSPVRVGSPGGGGSLEQSNGVASLAGAQNLNGLAQEAGQAQTAGGGAAIQAIGQSAKSEQAAIGLSAALQLGASNASSPALVHSRGDGGSVSQSNRAASAARALNGNRTGQSAAQRQATTCGCGSGAAVQALGQSASNAQLGLAASLALQCGASNGTSSLPTRSAAATMAPYPRGWRAC